MFQRRIELKPVIGGLQAGCAAVDLKHCIRLLNITNFKKIPVISCWRRQNEANERIRGAAALTLLRVDESGWDGIESIIGY